MIKVLLISAFAILAYANFSFAGEQENKVAENALGQKVFKNCAGCHLNGQNLIKEDKPIIGSKQIASKASFKAWLSEPHLPMPSYKKLTEDEEKLDALYKYVVSLMAGNEN